MTVKRIIVCIVSLALLAAAIYTAKIPQPISYGKGNGVNAKVESLEELHGVLQSIENISFYPQAAALADPVSEAAEHTSVTVIITDDQNAAQTYSRSTESISSNSSSNVAFQRELQIAIAEDAVYYSTTGKMITESASRSQTQLQSGSVTVTESVKNFFDFSFDIYLSADQLLIKAERLNGSYSRSYSYTNSADPSQNKTEEEKDTLYDDEVYDALSGNLGKWIDCRDHAVFLSELLSLNEENMDSLLAIGQLIEKASDGTQPLFEQEGDRYILREEELLQLFGVSADSVDFNGGLTVDLSQSDAPLIQLNGKSKTSADTQGTKATSNANCTFLFKNIDNTVIRLADDLQTIALTDLIGEEA